MKKRTVLRLTAAILFLLVFGCGIYVSDDYRAEETIGVLAPSVSMEISDDRMVFLPEEAEAGLIFYPGGKVEFTAYTPLMAKLAVQNILCVLLKMPLNLAVLDLDAAKGIPELFPEMEHWYLAGHSLGGSMAASYVEKNVDQYDGLVLLASYSTADLSASNIPVISVYGSEDGVLNMEKYEEYKDNLPSGFEEYIIEGGCHAGFGGYGPQDGDGIPTLSSENQIHETARLLAGFFR